MICRILLVFSFMAVAPIASGQTVYSTDYHSEADIVIYYTDYKTAADLLLYISSSQTEANQDLCDGIWYVARYKLESAFSYRVTEYRSRADIFVYRVSNKNQASANQKACDMLNIQ